MLSIIYIFVTGNLFCYDCYGFIADSSHAKIEFYLVGRSALLLSKFFWFIAFNNFPDYSSAITTKSLFSVWLKPITYLYLFFSFFILYFSS